MNKLLGVFTVILLYAISVQPVMALVRTGQEITIPVDQIVEGDAYLTGEKVTVLGKVMGDLYAAGGQVFVNGQVDGDALLAGGDVVVGGKIGQDLRVAGGNVKIEALVGKNVSYAAGNLDLDSKSTVSGSVGGVGGNIKLDGQISGELLSAGGAINIGAKVGKGAQLAGEDITLMPGGVIAGDVKYLSEKQLSDAGASVSGQVIRSQINDSYRFNKAQMTESAKEFGHIFKWWLKLSMGLVFLFIGLLIIKLVPAFTIRAVNVVSKQTFYACLIGLATGLGMMVFLGMLMISLIGIPLAILLGGGWLLVLLVAKLPVLVWSGNWVLHKLGQSKRAGWALVLGFIIYELILLIPVAGWFVRIGVNLVGLGALVLALRTKGK